MITSVQMKHICIVWGSKTVASIHNVFPSGGNADFYSRMQINDHKGVEWHSAIDCAKLLAPVVAICNLIMVVAGSGERVLSRFIVPHLY